MNRIKELRKQAGITQGQLAKIMNVRQTTVSMWETRNSIPDIDTTVELAKYFHVSVDYLLGKSDETPTPTDDNKTADPVMSEIIDLLYTLRDIPDGDKYIMQLTSKVKTMLVEDEQHRKKMTDMIG